MDDTLHSLADYEARATEILPAGTLGYYAGGAGDEATLADNLAAWGRRRLLPRALVDVSQTDTATTVLGTEVAFPVLVAPTALQRMAHPDGEAGMARAAAAAQTVMVLSTIATTRPRDVADAAPGAPRWFQVYVLADRGVTDALVAEAVASGFGALVLTVDAVRAGRRERDLRTGFAVPPEVDMPAVSAAIGSSTGITPAGFFELMDLALTWRDVERLVEDSPVPVVLKGIHHPEDAARACQCGVAGLVVSNHGGRQLDHVPATADMLGPVLDAVDGRLEVYVDGGIRRGTDVCTALAMGARAVLIGRPALYGLAVDGAAGAQRVLELLKAEVRLAMELLGAPRPQDLGPQHLA